MYIVITTSGDGAVNVKQMTKEVLLERLAEDYYAIEYGMIHASLPTNSDPMYWGRSLTIIKGDVVMPRPKQVVETYDID